MKEKTDSELIVAYRAGDKSALDQIVRRYLKPIYYFCAKIVGAEEANDMVQEVFIKVWKNISRYKTDKSFKVWLYRIARNTCLDQVRKKQPLLFSDLKKEDEEGVFEDGLVDGRQTALEEVMAAGDRADLEKALVKLPVPYQEVFELYYREQMTFQEISETLDVSINTVKSRHLRGLKELREIYASGGKNAPK